MTCQDIWDRLIEAGRSEIREAMQGEVGELASHLAACEGCRELARRILASDEAVAGALSAVRPEGSAASAARRARDESARRGARRRRRWSVVAAAAAIAGLVAVRSADVPLERGPGPTERLAHAGGAVALLSPEVEPLGGESVAVFETANPDIVVFWFYQGRGE